MLEWSEFARRLGRELAGLERDTILIVREREESRHYVQAMREPDRLYAEAVSNNFLDGALLLTLADEEVMSDAGWRPPADPSPRNWWTELPESGAAGGMQTVGTGDYSRLAEVMVTALRDVQGVRRPSDLVYESFHRHGTGLIELLDFGIDTADPSRVGRSRSSAEALGTGPLPAGTPPGGTPLPLPPEGMPATEADLLEPRLAEAKEHGDHTTYFDLLVNADLVLPATGSAVEDPDRAELPTITLGSVTYVTVFTSPGALARTPNPGLYRRTTFAMLASGWPDPSWQLAVNPGLPSEVLLDATTLVRLSNTPRTEPEAPNPYGSVDPHALSGPHPVAGGSVPITNGSAHAANGTTCADDHTAVDSYTVAELKAVIESGGVRRTPSPESTTADGTAVEDAGIDSARLPDEPQASESPPGDLRPVEPEPMPLVAPLSAPTGDGPVPERLPAVPLRPPHGTRLWQTSDEDDESPLAVYDAIGGAWTPLRTDPVPAPRVD
ncbi:TY-Chap domain-containing protein [Actinomadura graeca]|uniref:TY-Chap domain-containing protein n=1 Tax=Actinomadura graeca TaxID=2750812 RepID=UPI001E5BDCEF|nr:SseB family protein [Actinomadura graeca]